MLQFAREQCVKVVVMTPTRELCNQAAKNIAVRFAAVIVLQSVSPDDIVTVKNLLIVCFKKITCNIFILLFGFEMPVENAIFSYPIIIFVIALAMQMHATAAHTSF